MGQVATPGYSDVSVSASTAYQYDVSAFDAAGNSSVAIRQCLVDHAARPGYNRADCADRVNAAALSTTGIRVGWMPHGRPWRPGLSHLS